MIDKRGSIKRTGTQARPSAKATGTRMMSRPTNTPNRTMAACPAERTLPLIACPNQNPEFVDDLLTCKHHPRHAGLRPSDVDQPERQIGQLGCPIPREARELDAG